MTVPRVNPEIWNKLNNYKRKADIKLANVQQSLQKATFSILQCCDNLHTEGAKGAAYEVNKLQAIDAMRLLGHAIAELSNVRREQIKPALNRDYYSLCTPHDQQQHLFGEDLATLDWRRSGKTDQRCKGNE
ncbi:predicted protein [Nematostella vectensis]|uniref:Uncharacterized protein n=1 Tax=Nematostella vectensis TaxID=45351 RepID=A7S0X7_NEMVE|nr:predicted protein [Nematostella vectensis]|eukprot:XP_001634680.1 predicted protein [Nematostella vectensis]